MDKKFTCSQTKCKSIAVNVLTPHVRKEIIEDLKGSPCCVLSIDTSNHIDKQMAPVIVRYCKTPNFEIKNEILEFTNIHGETSDILVQHIMKVVEMHDISDKVIGILGDNTNTNFGGSKRKGGKTICFMN